MKLGGECFAVEIENNRNSGSSSDDEYQQSSITDPIDGALCTLANKHGLLDERVAGRVRHAFLTRVGV